MRRKPIILFAVLSSLIVGGYLLLRPNWKTATDAELRAVVDPALLEPVPSDPVAQRRYGRLLGILQPTLAASNEALPPGARPGSPEADHFIRHEGPALKNLDALLREGPLEAPHASPFRLGQSAPGMIRGRVLDLTVEGSRLVRKGRPRKGTNLLLLALRLARHVEAGKRGVIAYDHSTINVTDATRSIIDCLPLLPESELARIVPHFPATCRGDDWLQKAIRLDFQREVLPMVADPKAWIQGEFLNDLDYTLTSLARTGAVDQAAIVVDSYDAIATVREANRLFSSAHRNATRPLPIREPNGLAPLLAALRALPPNTAAGHKGWGYRWNLFLTRNAMRRSPNSYGIQLAAKHFTLVSFCLNEIDLRRTEEEAARTLLALRRYRLRFGASAPSLNALVEKSLLTKLPVDANAFRTTPLRYSVKAQKLWGVGMNGKDDGGADPADKVYKTP